MKIFNHCVYDCSAKELDEVFDRCKGDRCRSFCHTCMNYLEKAEHEDGYENVAWCTVKRRNEHE